jgi:two-component system, LuxR family, sensor kinase FixL
MNRPKLSAPNVDRDITERKSAERALRESAGQMRALIETAVDGVILIDGRGTVLMFNPACEKLFGYFAEDVIGKNVKMLMPEPYRDEHDGYIANYLDTRKPKIIGIGREVAGLRADGSTFPMDLSVGEAKHQGGGSIFVGIIRDITERRAAVQALNESERSFRLLVEGVVDYALFMLDPHGHVASWNSGAERIKGYRVDEIIGQHFSRFYTQEDQLDGQPARALQMAAEQGKFESEAWRLRKDGTRFWASVGIDAIRDETGTLIGFAKITRDLTDRKRAEADLQQTRSELARVARVTTLVELTAAIAHEVHQPLTGLVSSGNASLRWLAAEPPNLDAARRSIERMVDDGTRAGEVMGRIRNLVRRAPSRKDLLNVNVMILQAFALVDTEIHRNNIALHTELANDLPLVRGDRVQLQQVILNLFTNAIEAMSGADPAQRNLMVSSTKDGSNGVLVTVRDSGTGLDEAVLSQLFEAFYTTKTQGMGIGLAVSRSIIQAHGGRLWATPNQPQGAIFQFTLPSKDEQTS